MTKSIVQKVSDIQKSKLDITLLILSLGYFLDFYDLTLMSVSYNELIREQFKIVDKILVQQTYLMICNFQTIGIFLGAIFFGILGDKLGRAKTIVISILLYSVTTLLCVWTTYLPLFIFLRMLAYAGLSCEFAISSTLILERYSPKSANRGGNILYSFGVLGGVAATLIGFFSWQAMFIIGGTAGLVLCAMRSKLLESGIYDKIKKEKSEKLGRWQDLLKTKEDCLLLCKLFLLNVPFYALLSLIFIIPNFMSLEQTIGHAVKIVLMGFFLGNIISCLLSILWSEKMNSYRLVILVSLLIFVCTLALFPLVSSKYLFLYSVFMGLVGGAYPVAWMQLVGKSYPTEIRSTASNFLFALGRGSGIVFNLLLVLWLNVPTSFIANAIIAVVIVFVVALLALFFTKEKFTVLHY